VSAVTLQWRHLVFTIRGPSQGISQWQREYYDISNRRKTTTYTSITNTIVLSPAPRTQNGLAIAPTEGHIFISNGSISWQSRKQDWAPILTLEAEYIACSEASREGRWLLQHCKDINSISNEAQKVHEIHGSMVEKDRETDRSTETLIWGLGYVYLRFITFFFIVSFLFWDKTVIMRLDIHLDFISLNGISDYGLRSFPTYSRQSRGGF